MISKFITNDNSLFFEETMKQIKPRKRPQQKRSRDTVDTILNATAQVLIREGYDQTSTNKIAVEAGVSIGSLYHYFPNKEALVLALNRRLAEQELDLIRQTFVEVSNASLRDTIRKSVEVMVHMHRIAPELHRVLVEQVPRMGPLRKINEIDRQIIEMIREQLLRLKKELSPADAELMIFVVFNIVETLTHQAVLYQPQLLQGERLIDEISSLVELYLRKKMNL